MSIVSAAQRQRHRPRHRGVAERRRRRQGAQPGQHLRAPDRRRTPTRPRSRRRSSASARFSDIVGGETGVGGILILLAGVNVFVGLLNLFPVLPFDGGHAAIATYERIRSRKGRRRTVPTSSKMVPGRAGDDGRARVPDVRRPLPRHRQAAQVIERRWHGPGARARAGRRDRSTSARSPSAATRRSPCSR